VGGSNKNQNMAFWQWTFPKAMRSTIGQGFKTHGPTTIFLNFHSTSDGVPHGIPSMGHVAPFHWSSMMSLVNNVLVHHVPLGEVGLVDVIAQSPCYCVSTCHFVDVMMMMSVGCHAEIIIELFPVGFCLAIWKNGQSAITFAYNVCLRK
jgi:hypothetical protein